MAKKNNKFVHAGIEINPETPAVKACRMLLIETHFVADCREEIFEPARKILSEYAQHHRPELVCMHGPPHPRGETLGETGLSIEVYAQIPPKTLIYVVTVINRAQAEFLHRRYLQVFKGHPDKIAQIEKLGPMSIKSERFGCTIPVKSQELNISQLEQGIRRYLEAFVPALSNVAIKWMPEQQQSQLHAQLWRSAKATAVLQTIEEAARIIDEDR